MIDIRYIYWILFGMFIVYGLSIAWNLYYMIDYNKEIDKIKARLKRLEKYIEVKRR